ncbi:MAG: hypothetical protein MRQ09_02005 [Candidatus Midichloria sp.]|nr:hypothetical protein [Candidatus Midichloria sp.]
MVGTCHYALFSYLTYTAPDFSNLKTLGYKLPKGWEVLAVSASHILG